MSDAPIVTEIEPADASQQQLQAHCLATLKELTRHGYAADRRSAEMPGALLLRHPAAPDLVLREDGTLGLPPGQPLKAYSPSLAVNKPSWRRALFIVLLLAAYTFVTLAVMSTIISS